MKWAEEVEKGDAGPGQVQGHIRGHDLGQGQGTFKTYSRFRKNGSSEQIENFEFRTPRRHSPRRDRYRQKNENTGPNPYFVARRDERNKIIETSRLECCGKSPRPITDDSDDEKSNLIVKRGMITTEPYRKLLNVILERFASSDHDRKSHKKKKKKVLYYLSQESTDQNPLALHGSLICPFLGFAQK